MSQTWRCLRSLNASCFVCKLISHHWLYQRRSNWVSHFFYKIFFGSLWPWPWPKVTNFNRIWTNVKSNRLVKTASNSADRFDQHFVNKFRHVSGDCDLDLCPKVTNFNRVQASVISSRLAKKASKSVLSYVRLEFCWQTYTHRDRQTNWSKNITPVHFRGGVTIWPYLVSKYLKHQNICTRFIDMHTRIFTIF